MTALVHSDNNGGAPPGGEMAANGATLEAIAQATAAMLFLFNPEGICTYVSRQWLEYTGSSLQNSTGNRGFRFIHPDDEKQAQEIWTQILEHGQKFEIELRFRKHDDIYRWHRVCGVADRDEHGLIKRWVVMCTDIEEQKKKMEQLAAMHLHSTRATEELERTVAERTRQLQEVVEQLESFAYSIAHDMRAPLRAIHQYAETVATDFSNQVPQEAQVYLNKITAAAKKLDSLIRQVLIYTKVSQGAIKLQPMNIERLLSEILMIHPQLNPPNVELNVRLPMHAVIGDETALTQAFSNLLANAVKFVPPDRKPRVNIWTEQIGENVRVCIKDNGIGISTHNRQRLFKMFERLQPAFSYEGSGIGLTIVRRAVERMGGTLGVESEEGEGSTFWIELRKGEL